ncbi:hypothetical protein ACPPVV_13720 [Rhodanobacter sp. Col0626]|uniref:hypothetical protein n=1 Tax=Rhodanobacter sp. Col0626 TaxID=3415679 RepID=UPI003CEB3CDF
MTSSDKNRPDQHLEHRARELWHAAAQRIDPATAGRLRAARRKALEPSRATPHHTIRWLIPTGAFAVIALAAMMVWQPLPQRHAATSTQAVNAADTTTDLDNDLPPDADKTDPNLYQNLDFYGWLAANDSPPANR